MSAESYPSETPLPGTSPDILNPPEDAEPTILTVIGYGADSVEEVCVTRPEQLRDFGDRFSVLWVDCSGLGAPDLLRRLSKVFGIHRLALEDLVHTGQRPKFEEYGEQRFLICQRPCAAESFETEQIGIVVGEKFLLSVQESRGDDFSRVRDRLRVRKSRIRRLGTDYLLYAILDAVVDSYFPVLARYEDELEEIEDVSVENFSDDVVRRVHQLRREISIVRRAMFAQREALGALLRDDGDVISEETQIHLRDVHDHAVRLVEQADHLRDFASSLLDLQLSLASQRLNDVIRVLTVISTIFIPLTFLAGIYGMNFEGMPELHAPGGYWACLAVMASVAALLIVYFRRKGWI